MRIVVGSQRREDKISYQNTINRIKIIPDMKKISLLLFATIVSLAAMAQLNPYAYGLSSNWNATTQTLTVNFKLNAKTSKKIIIYAVDPNNKNTKYKIHEIASPGEKLDFSENIHIIGKLWGSNDCLPVNKDLTFAVEVSGERTTPGTPIYTANRPYSPHGVAVNNCQDSQDFGAVYVTECTNGVSGNDTWGWLSDKGRSLLEYNPRLEYADFHRKKKADGSDEFFSLRNVVWNADGTRKSGGDLLEPHRVVVSDDGRIFVSSYNKNNSNDKVAVWEYNRQTRMFTPIVYHNTSYGNRVVAIDIKGTTGNNLKMLVCYLKIATNDNGYHVYEYNIGNPGTTATVIGKKCGYVPSNGDGTQYQRIQDLLAECISLYYFHYTDGLVDVAYGAKDPTTVFIGIDYFVNKNYRTTLAYHKVVDSKSVWSYYNTTAAGQLYGGGGLVTYLDHDGNERIAMGRCQTGDGSESDGRIQVYARNASDVPSDIIHTIQTKTRNVVNDIAIDCANNIYAVSFTDNTSKWSSGTGTLLAVPMPYSGTVTTYCPSSNANANKYFKLPARTTLNMNTMDQEELDRVVSNNSDKCDCDITLSRPIQGDMFNTICLPFDLDLSKVSSLQNAELKEFSGARLETLDNEEQILTLTFTDVSPKKIIAYKPYLIKPASTISGSIEINDIRMVKSSGDQTVEKDVEGTTNSISFIPVVTTQNVTPRLEGNESLTFMLVTDNRLAMLTSSGVMPGFHAYFEFASAPPKGAKARISTSENTTTDAEVIIDGQTINVEKFLREGRVYIRMGETLYTIDGVKVE